eukprot:scaffold3.g6165.t1
MTSSILLRRKCRGPPASSKLGAVKLAGAGSDTGSDAAPSPSESVGSSVGAVTPQDSSPLLMRTTGGATPPTAAVGPAVQAAAARQAVHHQLPHAHSADDWLDSQLTPPSAGGGECKQRAHRSPSLANVESAAAQIVSKAMQYLTVGERGSTKDSTPKLDFLDKGLGAIMGVGKIMEGFALTLDSVIGQAFEEWTASPKLGAAPAVRAPLRATQAVAAPATRQSAAAAWDDAFEKGSTPSSSGQTEAQEGGRGQRRGQQTRVTSFMTKINAASEGEVQEWRRRAQQLAQELQKLKEQQEEYQRIREQYDRLQAEAAQRKAAAAAPLGPLADPLADPLAAQQVTQQMEVLLAEKAKLAQENARLLRENTGLQELLDFAMIQAAETIGDDELFEEGEEEYAVGELDGELAGGGPIATGAIAAGALLVPSA